MPRTTAKTTTQRGLGWKHRQQREALLRRMSDGSLCWWCNRPMFKQAERNWDNRALAADHTIARAVGGTRADRMLHATCNGQRGDGTRDADRPAITGKRMDTAPQHQHLAMDW